MIFFPTEPLGTENYSQAMFDFYDFILAHGLIDLPLEGDSFTWSNTPSDAWTQTQYDTMTQVISKKL